MTSTIDISPGYVEKCAGPVNFENIGENIAKASLDLKNFLVARDMTELAFEVAGWTTVDQSLKLESVVSNNALHFGGGK